MGDEIGEKPAGIDPAKIISDSGVSSAPPDMEEVERIAESVQQQVQSPNYSSVHSQVPNLPVPIPANGDVAQGVLQASFNPAISVPDYIRGTMEQLSGIQKFLHGRDLQKLNRSQVLKLTKELFDYQYKDMQHLLMLGMDVQKKTRFVQYLNATKSLQNRIQRDSATAQLEVINTQFDNMEEAYKTKNTRDSYLREAFDKGVLVKKQYDKMSQDNERLTDEHVKRLDQTAAMLVQRHAEFLFKTLELFKAGLIESGKI